MKLSELYVGTDVNFTGEDADVTGVAIDSRAVKPGDLFIAIPGTKTDGRVFIDDARSKGAAAILAEPDTANARAAASIIAGNFYDNPAKDLRLFGVTGTNGKTSVTYFLEAIFREAGLKTGIIGTTGARIGDDPIGIDYATSTTPDPVELHRMFRKMAEGGVSAVVMEATSHALFLDKLHGLNFEAAAITNLTQDHLDFHKDMDAYAAAKARLFGISRTAVVNADDAYVERFVDISPQTITYGVSFGDYKAQSVNLSGAGVSFDLAGAVTVSGVSKAKTRFYAPIPGLFTVYNLLAAVILGRLGGAEDRAIQSALSKLKGVPGRIEPIPNEKGLSIFVDYAHTPDGLTNVLKSVKSFTNGRVIAVFGCGGDRDSAKRPLMGKAVGKIADFSFITSDNPRNENPEDIIEMVVPGIKETGAKFVTEPDRKTAIFEAVKLARPGDSVVICGKGHEDYQEFENKRRVHFDDRETAREALL